MPVCHIPLLHSLPVYMGKSFVLFISPYYTSGKKITLFGISTTCYFLQQITLVAHFQFMSPKDILSVIHHQNLLSSTIKLYYVNLNVYQTIDFNLKEVSFFFKVAFCGEVMSGNITSHSFSARWHITCLNCSMCFT